MLVVHSNRRMPSSRLWCRVVDAFQFDDDDDDSPTRHISEAGILHCYSRKTNKSCILITIYLP
jgi:hypothetical protein